MAWIYHRLVLRRMIKWGAIIFYYSVSQIREATPVFAYIPVVLLLSISVCCRCR